MLGAFSLLKVIESELQGYLSATKGRVVCTSPLVHNEFIKYDAKTLLFNLVMLTF